MAPLELRVLALLMPYLNHEMDTRANDRSGADESYADGTPRYRLVCLGNISLFTRPPPTTGMKTRYFPSRAGSPGFSLLSKCVEFDYAT